MRPLLLRAVVLVVCAAGIAGMIVASILDSNGAALTFGLVTAGAVVCLIVTTAVTGGGNAEGAPVQDRDAMAVEALVQDLVAGGADEVQVRELVRAAARLHRNAR